MADWRDETWALLKQLSEAVPGDFRHYWLARVEGATLFVHLSVRHGGMKRSYDQCITLLELRDGYPYSVRGLGERLQRMTLEACIP